MPKFSNVPVDNDTTILHEKEITVAGYQILYQKWDWDGVVAESFIFSNEDVTGIDDADIKKLVRTSPLYEEGEIIVKRLESGFTFANFNFRS